MYTSDKRIIKLIELLIFQRKISFVKEFCEEIGILTQSVSKIKKGLNHFTVKHIETICRIYNVNANWIFGIDDTVFNSENSIKIKEV